MQLQHSYQLFPLNHCRSAGEAAFDAGAAVVGAKVDAVRFHIFF